MKPLIFSLLGCIVILFACNRRAKHAEPNGSESVSADTLVRAPIPSDSLALVSQDSTSPQALMDQAKSLASGGKYREALSLTREGLDLVADFGEDPVYWTARGYELIGRIYFSLRTLDSAYHWSKRAVETCETLGPKGDLTKADAWATLAKVSLDRSQYDQALAQARKGLAIREARLRANHAKIMNLYDLMATVWYHQGAYRKSLKMHENILAQELKEGGPKTYNVALGYFNIGRVALILGSLDQAIDSAKQALAILQQIHPPREDLLAGVYNLLGATFFSKGDFETASEYVMESLRIKKALYGETHYLLNYNYRSLGSAAHELGNLDQAITYFQASMNILEVNGLTASENYGLDQIYLGATYAKNGQPEQALSSIRAGEQTLGRALGFDHLAMVNVYNIFASFYHRMGDDSVAISYCLKALEIGGVSNNITVFATKGFLGEIYNATGAYDKSIALAKKTARQLGYALSSPYNFDKAENLNILRQVLSNLDEAYQQKYHAQEKQPEAYLDSLYTLHQARVALERHCQIVFAGSSVRNQHASKAIPAYEDAIAFLYRQQPANFLPRVFSIFEQAKSRQLFEHMQASDLQSHFGLSEDERQKEHQLNVDIAFFEKKVFELAAVNSDSLRQAYQDRLFDLNRSKDSLLQVYQEKYPRYYSLRYDPQVLEVTEVQTKILKRPQQVLVEYFVGDSALYVLTILKDTIGFRVIPKDFELDDMINQFRCALFASHTMERNCTGPKEAAQDEYLRLGYELYQKLFAPIEPYLPDKAEVMLIPDGVLGYIPFETLLTSPPTEAKNYYKLPYLLRDYAISYSYSATSHRAMEAKQHEQVPRQMVLAMAPFAEPGRSIPPTQQETGDTSLLRNRSIDIGQRRNWLSPLRYSDDEVRGLAQLLSTDTLMGQKATKQMFLDHAPDYRILHLATHGKANDKVGEYSFLAFHEIKDSLQNEWLYNRELYNLKLNADLVVLSACETGIGELQRGEGIISLARGFSYAGAKSIVTSLWRVDDQGTASLMTLFYRHLKAGMPKHQALRQAKLDFLETQPSRLRSPYYWASFIAIGDVEPIDLQRKPPYWIWGIGGGLLLLMVLGYARWRRKRTPIP